MIYKYPITAATQIFPVKGFDELLQNIVKLIDRFEEEAHIEASPNRVIDCSIRVLGTLDRDTSPWFVWDGEKFVGDK